MHLHRKFMEAMSIFFPDYFPCSFEYASLDWGVLPLIASFWCKIQFLARSLKVHNFPSFTNTCQLFIPRHQHKQSIRVPFLFLFLVGLVISETTKYVFNGFSEANFKLEGASYIRPNGILTLKNDTIS